MNKIEDRKAVQDWEEAQHQAELQDIEKALEAFRSILFWLGSTPNIRSACHTKVVALLVVLNRSAFGQKSVLQIARQCGVSVCALQIAISRFRRTLPREAVTRKTYAIGENISRAMSQKHASKNEKTEGAHPTPGKESFNGVKNAGDRRPRSSPMSA